MVQSDKMPERQEVYQQVGEQLTSSFSILVVGCSCFPTFLAMKGVALGLRREVQKTLKVKTKRR